MVRAVHLSPGPLLLCLALAACAAEDPNPPTFQSLYEAIIQPRCTSCHKPGGLCPYLDLSSPSEAQHTLLTARASDQGLCRGAGRLVDPAHCETSLLYRKVLGGDAPCGNRMPLRDVPLTDDEIATVCEWISRGAH